MFLCLWVKPIYICMSTGMKTGLRKRRRGLGTVILIGVPAWMPANMQTNSGTSDVHAQWFPTGRSEQTIMMSFHDVMRISCAIEGRNYQASGLSSGSSDTKHSGLLTSHRPSTLAISVPLMEQSITRMDCVICLFICMYPDLSGELLVSVTLVV